MTRTLTLVFFLLLFSFPLYAQIHVDLGIAGGTQGYETSDLDSRFLVSPEIQLSRGPLALYYSLDYADLSSAGPMYASHLGLAYRWMIDRKLLVAVGAGPSYISVEQLGGEPSAHVQLELAVRTGRMEWFGRLRYYDYTLEEFHVANASPDGVAAYAGVRVRVR